MSFALTSNLTIVGLNLGLLKREAGENAWNARVRRGGGDVRKPLLQDLGEQRDAHQLPAEATWFQRLFRSFLLRFPSFSGEMPWGAPSEAFGHGAATALHCQPGRGVNETLESPVDKSRNEALFEACKVLKGLSSRSPPGHLQRRLPLVHTTVHFFLLGVVKPHNFFQKPKLLVASRGYSVARNSSYLDTRFEIHSVSPERGSEEGGALVTVRGVGFGNKALTPQLTIAALGTLGDVVSWSDTEARCVWRGFWEPPGGLRDAEADLKR